MMPSDRPVLAEPEGRREPSGPLRVPLRALFRLRTGRCVRCARAVSPSQADHGHLCSRCIGQDKPCRGCGAMIRGRINFCAACREAICHHCRRLGGLHLPSCPWRETRACIECGQPIERAGRLRRLARCARCRPNTVTLADLEAAYVVAWPRAVRLARRLVGRPDAEDVVQITVLSLWNALDGLHGVGPELFMATVRLRALHWRRRWRHQEIPLSPEMFLAEEQMAEASRRGRPRRDGDVRLPEPVG